MKTNLSQALTQYFERQKARIVFKNGLSLNQLALAMWERLDFREVDASVVSRVLRGERLFTPSQLDIFCSVLKVSSSEREYLHHCLHRDHEEAYGVSLGPLFFSSSFLVDILKNMIHRSYYLLYKGQYEPVTTLSALLVDTIKRLVKTVPGDKKRDELFQFLGTSLYLQTRALYSSILSLNTRQYNAAMHELSKIARSGISRELTAFHFMAHASMYYVGANYSSSVSSYALHRKAIKYAKLATDYFPDDHPDKLFAYRTILTCAAYTRNEGLFTAVKADKNVKRLVDALQPDHYIMGVHLYHTIARGEAVFRVRSALNTYEKAKGDFGDAMRGKGMHELADIRNELEMLCIVKSKETSYIQNRAQRGLFLAEELGSNRHKHNINKLLTRLLS